MPHRTHAELMADYRLSLDLVNSLRLECDAARREVERLQRELDGGREVEDG